MSLFRRKRRRPSPQPPPGPRGDPEGVANAECLAEDAKRRLDRDRKSTIDPLRRIAERNDLRWLGDVLAPRQQGGNP